MSDENPKEKKWFLPDDKTLEAKGPFTLNEISDLLNEGALRLDDFIWNDSLENRWHRVYELPEFLSRQSRPPVCGLPRKFSKGSGVEKANLEGLDNVKGDFGAENKYRRFPRAPFEARAFIHNQHQLIDARVTDISENGLSLEVQGEMPFSKGDEVVVVVRSEELGTFSFQAVIMREKKSRGLCQMGVFFFKINPRTKRRIAHEVLKRLTQIVREQEAS